jgi:hypothetical protein
MNRGGKNGTATIHSKNDSTHSPLASFAVIINAILLQKIINQPYLKKQSHEIKKDPFR